MDIWVGLVSAPRADIGVQPRHVSAGSTVVIPAVTGGTYLASSPNGQLLEGSSELGTRVSVDTPGEWLFELRDAQGTVALWPVYVGIIPPDLGLFEEIETSESTDIQAQLQDTINGIREAYDLPSQRRADLLDAAARALFEDGKRELSSVARGVGYEPATVGMWSCRGPSVESCLDKVLWNPRSRASFLGPQNEFGWVVEASEGQLHVVAVVAEG